jgi:hypothetical protein
MRGFIALGVVFLVAACNVPDTPDQSQAQPSVVASSGAGPQLSDKEPKAPPTLPAGEGEPLAASGAGGAQSDMVDVSTAEGRARLQASMSEMMDQATTRFASGYRSDPGLVDQFPLMRLRDSPYLWQASLVAGVNYRFLGGCDMDCNNVDLELVNASGQVVASDLAADDFPSMSFTPSAAGVYTVRVHLRTCNIEPCMVALRSMVR